MGLLTFVFTIFILAFPVGEIGRVQLSNGLAFSLNDILLVTVIAVWFLNHVLRKRKFTFGKLIKPIVIFSAVGLLSLLVNFQNLGLNNFAVSAMYLVRWIAYAMIYIIVTEFDTKFKKRISYLLLFSGSIVVFWGYIQYFFYPYLGNLQYLGWDSHLNRMFSSFLDPNFAGAFFALFFIFAISFTWKLFKIKDMGKALIILFVSLADLIAVYLTYSRSALIMLVAAVITYLALQKQKKLAFAAIVLLIAIIFFLPKQSHSTFTEGTNFLRITSGVERLDSIQTGVKIFEQSPVLGVGFNAYRYAQHKVGLTNIYWQVTHSGAGTDNGFLFVLTTAGIIGLTAFIYLLFCIFRQAKSQLKQNVHSVVLFAVLLGLILDGFFVNSLFYVLLLEWIWIFAALTEKS